MREEFFDPSAQSDADFSALVQRLLEGQADAAALRALEAELLSDPAKRELFAAHCLQASMMSESLRERIATLPTAVDDTASGGGAVAASAGPAQPRSRRWSAGRRWLIAAALLLVAGLAVSLTIHKSSAAMISAVLDARWEGQAGAITPGGALPETPMTLERGLVQLTLKSGARVVVEGPARFRVASPEKIELTFGKLTAHVPAPAVTFTVQTPQATLVDLGTEFGVDVGGSGTTYLQVFQGKVSARGSQAPRSSTRVLEASQAAEVTSPAAAAQLVPPRPERFVHPAPPGTEGGLLERQLVLNTSLQDDPSMVAHYMFDKGKAANVLANIAPRTTGRFNGRIENAAWDQGRVLGKSALRFNGQQSRVLLNVPGTMQAFTMAAWVNLSDWKHNYNGLLLSDGEMGEQGVHWQIFKTGALELGISRANPTGKGKPQFIVSRSTQTLGDGDSSRWALLCVVLDSPHHRVRHYLDGKLIGETALSEPLQATIGSAEIGNWNPQGTQRSSRALDGRIDELVIFERALAGAEVAAMYQQATN